MYNTHKNAVQILDKQDVDQGSKNSGIFWNVAYVYGN